MKNSLLYFLLITISINTIIKSSNQKQPSTNSTQNTTTTDNAQGIFFQGLTENGVKKNTFLCGDNSVTNTGTSGNNKEASDCTISSIQNAIGLDISNGQQLQIFNNFTFWSRKKTEKEQFYHINYHLKGKALKSKMNSEGWGQINAFCILISTNKIFQETVYQSITASEGETKVIVQLLYNGDNLIQLWSQDAAILKPGQSFTVAITNQSDDRLVSTFTTDSSSKYSYLAAISPSIEPNNKNSDSYNGAIDSPRMVRIAISQ